MTRRIAFAVAAMSIGQIAVYMVRPATSYRLLGLGWGGGAVGLVAASFALLPLLLAIPLGRRADRRRAGRLLLGGCAVEAAGCVLLAAGRGPLALAAASAVLGVGHLMLALGSQAVIARESGDARHDRHFALLTAGVAVGQLLGPLAAGLLIERGGGLVAATTRTMLVAAAVAAVAAVCAAVAERGPGAAEAPDRERVGMRAIVRTRGVAPAIFVSVAALSATDIFTAYLPVLGEQRSLAPAAVGVLLALRAGATLLSRLGIGGLVARVGRERLIGIGLGTAAAALVGMTVIDDVAVLAVLAAAAGAGVGFAQPLSMTMVVRLVPDHARASALALRLTGNRIGQVAAPAAGGAVAGAAGAASVFWMTGALLGVSVLALQRSKRPEPVAEEVERRRDDDRERLREGLAEPGLD